jgi:hypothetical protein
LPVSVTPGITFNDMSFPTFSSGWVVGGSSSGGQVRHTTDAGKTWQAQDVGAAALNAVQFITPAVGWVGGDGGTLYQTQDGGATWSPLSIGSSANIRGLYFRDTQNGLVTAAGTGGGIYTTSDGGKTWSVSLQDPTEWRTGIWGLPDGTCFFYDSLYKATIRASNGGQAMVQVSGQGNSELYDLTFAPESPTVLLASLGGGLANPVLLRSTNGGQTWTKMAQKTTGLAYDPDHCPIFGPCGADEGNFNWLGIGMVNALEALAVRSDGNYYSLVETKDGGFTWNTLGTTTQQVPAGWRFFAFDRHHAWTTGGRGQQQLVRIGQP